MASILRFFVDCFANDSTENLEVERAPERQCRMLEESEQLVDRSLYARLPTANTYKRSCPSYSKRPTSERGHAKP